MDRADSRQSSPMTWTSLHGGIAVRQDGTEPIAALRGLTTCAPPARGVSLFEMDGLGDEHLAALRAAL